MPRAGRRSSIPASPNTDDIKHTIGHFAAGMVANPEAVPKCPRDVYLADQCPADTLIGSSEADVHVLPPVGPVLTEPGRIYNVVQQGTEAGRLGIIVDATLQGVPRGGVLRAQQGRLRARRRPRQPAAHAARHRRHPDPPPEVHAVRHRAGPQVHARPDIVLAEGLDRRGRGVRPPRVRGRARPTRTRRPTATSCRSRRRSRCRSGDKGSTGERQKPPLQRDRHAEGLGGRHPRQRRHAAVRDRPEPARLHDDLHARAERGRTPARRARRWAPRPRRRRSWTSR